MKYLEEYRDPKLAQQLADSIRGITTRPWTIMEMCGAKPIYLSAGFILEEDFPMKIFGKLFNPCRLPRKLQTRIS